MRILLKLFRSAERKKFVFSSLLQIFEAVARKRKDLMERKELLIYKGTHSNEISPLEMAVNLLLYFGYFISIQHV